MGEYYKLISDIMKNRSRKHAEKFSNV